MKNRELCIAWGRRPNGRQRCTGGVGILRYREREERAIVAGGSGAGDQEDEEGIGGVEWEGVTGRGCKNCTKCHITDGLWKRKEKLRV